MNLEPATEETLRELIAGTAYEDRAIWKGDLWTLYLNEDQHYLGRSYAWLTSRHIDFHQLYELTPAEWQELQLIMRAHRATVGRLWDADMVNCSWLGNEYPMHRGHGHMHLVPRYKKPPRRYDGRKYPDKRFGSDYKPYKQRILPKEDLDSIIIDFRNVFLNLID